MLDRVIKPMDPVLGDQPFDDPEFLYQVKWDGIRFLVFCNQGELRLQTKRGEDHTYKFPEMEAILDSCKAQTAILDGELVVLNNEGKPDFEKVLQRERLRSRSSIEHFRELLPVTYMVFDILYQNGRSLCELSLEERLQILEETVLPGSYVQITESFSEGIALYEAVCREGLEGIVAKRRGSGYYPGRKHPDWVKIKCWKKQLCVAGGATLRQGLLSSLLAGSYSRGRLFYVGSVGVGLSRKEKLALVEFFQGIRQENPPFVNPPVFRDRGVIWVLPVLTFYVTFLEWTTGGLMRSPRLLGFSTEPPEDCILER
jgi:bifunctional non-homologous end joining protein LigD